MKLMQPILLVAVVAVAAVAMSTGFLGNDIDLWVQEFGTGSEIISTPVTHAIVDFNIVKTTLSDGYFLNIVDACLVTLGNTVGATMEMGTAVNGQSEIQCKLSDSVGNIIAEGNQVMTYFPGGVAISVPVTMVAPSASGPPVDVEDVHDVHLVVKANTHS